MTLSRDEIMALLIRFADNDPIDVAEDVHMEDPFKGPVYEADGSPMIRDVVQIGDGRLWIERDDNDPEAVQAFIDLLSNLHEFLPDLIAALEVWLA